MFLFDRWFPTDLRGYLEAMIGGPGARIRAHLEGSAVEGMLAEHLSGAANHRERHRDVERVERLRRLTGTGRRR